MIVYRWVASLVPSKEQLESFFEKDGLDYFEENFPVGTKVPEHRHPFDEVRMIIKGKILYSVSGNKVLLRPGDRIIIPSNTLHFKQVSEEACSSLCGYQVY